jgi:hypothetical protein
MMPASLDRMFDRGKAKPSVFFRKHGVFKGNTTSREPDEIEIVAIIYAFGGDVGPGGPRSEHRVASSRSVLSEP